MSELLQNIGKVLYSSAKILVILTEYGIIMPDFKQSRTGEESMKKLNERSKAEQLFIVILMFVALIGVFCITGCGGGKSCETPKCGSEEIYGATAHGCSIPGCGGCLSSGRGCNTACWPQACKYVSVSGSEENQETGEKESMKIKGCDVRYFGDGCLGCGQREKSCYYGCMKEDASDFNGFFYGTTDREEKIIGCEGGCVGCVGSDGAAEEAINALEDLTGVD